MIRLYQNWYDDLLIDQLYPVNSSINFEGLFYKNKWDKNPKDDKSLKEYLDYDNYDFWLSAPILHNIQIYFGYEHGKVLVEDGFLFRVIEKSANGVIEKIKIPEKEKNYITYIPEDFSEIQGDFRLISTDPSSYEILLKDILNWIKGFPDENIKNSVLDYFNKSLKKENTLNLRVIDGQ